MNTVFTSRSVAALREHDLANHRPRMPPLTTAIGTRSKDPEPEPSANGDGEPDPEATMIRSGPAAEGPAGEEPESGDRWEE